MAWDDAKKAKAVELYLAGEPNPENSMEIVAEIADELDETVNGVRMILSKATQPDGSAVYIKKNPAKPSAAAGGTKAKAAGAASTRVSKEDAHNVLIAAIEAHGQTADTEIVTKMTGKAAQHFTALFGAITPAAE